MGFGDVICSKTESAKYSRIKLVAIECGIAVGNIKNVVSESMSDLVWVSRDESKKAMDYKGHDK